MKKLYVKLAADPISREYGLKDRKSLGKNAGMLFRFPRKQILSFWMSQTYVPLDIAFLDDDGTISQIETMTPMSTRSIQSKTACKYALEVNKGWFDNNNIVPGKKIAGYGLIKDPVKTAQSFPAPKDELLVPGLENEKVNIEVPEDIDGEIDAPENIPEEIVPNPSIELNKSFEAIFEESGPAGQNLEMIYQKDGVTLPPKVISPIDGEYEIEHGPNGDRVRAYDNSPNYSDEQQTQYGKTFLLDNIIDLEPYNKTPEATPEATPEVEEVPEIEEGIIKK